MRRTLLMLLVPLSADAQTLTDRLRDCYALPTKDERAECIDWVMDPSTSDPPMPAVVPVAPAAQWTHRVRVDSMSDEYSCDVGAPGVARDGSPVISFRTKHPPVLFLMGDNYPGRNIAVRVDELPAIESTEADEEFMRGARLAKFLSQARAGQRVRTRFIAWPSGAPVDASFDLDGFAAVVDRCKDAVARVKRGEPSPL
jgi:hypothetical protein